MRTAIIGTGFVAEIHAQILKELGHQIVIVINPHREKAEAFAQHWNIKKNGADYHQVLEAGIDTIHICTPPTSHFSIVKDALDAGIHVLCEKPLCLDPIEAFELQQLAQEKHLIGAVNFNVRFHDACQQAKNLITSPDFEQVCLIHGSYLQEFHTLPNFYSWRYQPELAGPMRAVTEIGSHWIDLVRYWTGLEIDAVSANFGAFSPDRFLADGIMYTEAKENARKIRVDSEDAAMISLRLNNGAVGSLLLSEVSHGRSNQLKLEVSSRTHSLWWNSEEPYQLHQAQGSGSVVSHTNPFGGGFSSTFHDCFAQFYDAVETGQASEHSRYATFLDGAINAAICAAIYESAVSNSAWVKIQSA